MMQNKDVVYATFKGALQAYENVQSLVEAYPEEFSDRFKTLMKGIVEKTKARVDEVK